MESFPPRVPSAAGRVLLIGGVVTLAFIVLAQLNLGRQGVLWDNAHWTLSGIVATIAGVIGTRATTGRERRVRAWVTVSVACWTIGMVIWDFEALFGVSAIVTPADVFWVGMAVPGALALRVGLNGRVRPREEFAVYLDSASVCFAVAALVITAFGAAAADANSLPGVLLLVYPILFLGVTGAALVGAVATHAELRPRGSYAILLASGVLAVAWLGWLSLAVQGPVPSGSFTNPLFSAAVLIGGWGAATFSVVEDRSPRMERWVERVGSMLPAGAAVVATVILILDERVVDPRMFLPVSLAAGLTIACSVARQTILLFDRARIQHELEALNTQARRALDDQAASEAEHRVRAEQLARVLAASEDLVVVVEPAGGEGEDPFTKALRLVSPDGVSACLSRWDPALGTITWLASHGDAPGIVPGEVRPIGSLPAEWQSVVTTDRIATYRRPAEPATDESAVVTPSTHLLLPLHDQTGAVQGLLHFEDGVEARVFESTFVDLARLLANQLGVAFENARLVAMLQTRIAQMDRVQTQLIAASKRAAVGELAAAIAHEVNNPLTGVLGYTELLLARAPAEGSPREELEVVRTEALRARGIVWALMDFARPRAPEHRPSDLTELIATTLDLTRYHLLRGGVTINEDYVDLPAIDLDPDAIRQALLNVINNAVQAIGPAGVLTLSSRIAGGDAVVTISDDGVGMDQQTIEQAFVPFFTTRDAHEGTGLGLSVTQVIVESHGGRVRLSSSLGVGTTVEIRLPLVAPASNGALRPEEYAA